LDGSNILITGANGQLGRALQSIYPKAVKTDAPDLDITDAEALMKFNWDNIEIIINAAAYTNVDGAETKDGEAAAWLVNDSRPDYGTYNITNEGEPVSWADFTRAIFKAAGIKQEVANTTTAEYFKNKPDSAPRPLNSVMDLTKIEATGFRPRNWRDDLEDYIKKEVRK
jgi:dTDP-4-dehydrorhamnose reductase